MEEERGISGRIHDSGKEFTLGRSLAFRLSEKNELSFSTSGSTDKKLRSFSQIRSFSLSSMRKLDSLTLRGDPLVGRTSEENELVPKLGSAFDCAVELVRRSFQRRVMLADQSSG